VQNSQGSPYVLEQYEFHLEHRMTFGGLATIGWALRSRLARLQGRPDLVDRAEAGYRRSLTQQGQLMPAWSLWVYRKVSS
jgi:hypothetical protein